MEIFVYNNQGVCAVHAHKDGSKIMTSATANVNVSGITVKSALHVGYHPQLCSKGEHSYLLIK